MVATRWQALALACLGAGVVSWLVWRTVVAQGGLPPQVPWSVVAILLVVAGVVLWLGLAVRAYQRGKRPNLEPLRAARTAVLAKASSITGALLSGWYGAQAIVLLADLANEPVRSSALSAGVAAIAAIVLAVVGLVVERFCRLPPPEGGETTESSPEAYPA